MAFWRNVRSLLSGSGWRVPGTQQSGNASYSSDAELAVTHDTALCISAVYACVKLIAESVASLDLCFYYVDRATGNRKEADDHPLYQIFGGKVNRYQTRQEFFETLTYQLVMFGNAYAAIQKNAQGKIIALLPLMTQQMEVALLDDGSVVYKYNDGKNMRVFAQDSIWHNKGFGNGITGIVPLECARNSIGIAQGAEKTVGKIYKNGGKPSGILMLDKVLTKEQRDAIKASFSELAEGNNDRLFVLEAGMKYEQVSLSPQDIELLASRRFQIEDIARFFGVPSVLINDTSTSTAWGSGIQQIVQGFYKLGLRPYLRRYEASILAWLLSPADRIKMDVEFKFNDLLRPDQFERLKGYKEAILGGEMTPNEARAEEGWAPKPGGDNLYMQQQMIALDDPNRGKSTSQGTFNGN